MPDSFNLVMSHWEFLLAQSSARPWSQRISKGDVSLAHYKGYLQETYHNTGLNPQLQAFATMYFRQNHRDLFDLFYKHAISEIGHDLLALNDLKALGVKTDDVVVSRPLPTTRAVNATAIYQIQFIDPLCYLGYLFHLEFLPTRSGQGYLQVLRALGVPMAAMTFIEEHAKVDIGHNKLMQKYFEAIVKTKSEIDLVVLGLETTAVLHTLMIENALENGEKIFA